MIKSTIWMWPLLPCMAFSILLHSTDSDTGGLTGVISSPALLLSAALWAIPVVIVAYIGFACYLKNGVIGFFCVTIPFSGVLGYLVARMGSTATTQAGFLWSSIGASLVLLAVLSVAVAPSALVMQRYRELSVETPA